MEDLGVVGVATSKALLFCAGSSPCGSCQSFKCLCRFSPDQADCSTKGWFEAALQKHFMEWKPPPVDHSRWRYIQTSHVCNARFHEAPLRTYDEQQFDPYPPHIETQCHPSVFGDSLGEAPGEFAEMTFDLNWKGVLCWIMDRYVGRDGEIVYDLDAAHYTAKDYFVRKRHVERNKIAFADKPYTSDLHLPGAFRHPIHMPDEMFPDAWRNNK